MQRASHDGERVFTNRDYHLVLAGRKYEHGIVASARETFLNHFFVAGSSIERTHQHSHGHGYPERHFVPVGHDVFRVLRLVCRQALRLENGISTEIMRRMISRHVGAVSRQKRSYYRSGRS